MKSIKMRIISIIASIVIAVSVLMGLASCFLNYSSAMSVLKETLVQTAVVASNQVSATLQSYKNIAIETGCLTRLTNDSISLEDKRTLIDQKVTTHNFINGDVIGEDGRSIFNPALDVSGQEYFKAAMRGETYITDPVVNSETGQLNLTVAAPLWADGTPGTTVRGVVCFVPQETILNDIVNTIKVGQNGNAYIIDQNGTTIAYYDFDLVKDRYNTQQEAKNDPELKSLAEQEQKMMNGETAYGDYQYGGTKKVMAYSPIQGTNGWSLTVNAGRNEFLSGVGQSIIFTVILIIIFLILGIAIAIYSGNKIGKPIMLSVERIEALADGDLHSPVPDIQRKDETGKLAEVTKIITNRLQAVIQDTSYLLKEMSQKNMVVESHASQEYVGDFSPLLTSLNTIVDSLNLTLTHVNVTADQVASGSDQVANGAQALSQGSTEQASSVEELAATFNEISVQIKDTAASAKDALIQANRSGEQVASCNNQMTEMIRSIEEISDTSSEIGKIIKTIEDIAFQTNILALNAAVEAARAGAAGKGFAVVADEVRNLASKSAEASKSTAALIEGSIRAVEKGTQIANETAGSLLQVVDGTKQVGEYIGKISDAAEHQADVIAQVTIGIDQISSVVQTNSATAEESAAASEELSGQAQMLKELVGSFKLKEGGGSGQTSLPASDYQEFREDQSFMDTGMKY